MFDNKNCLNGSFDDSEFDDSEMELGKINDIRIEVTEEIEKNTHERNELNAQLSHGEMESLRKLCETSVSDSIVGAFGLGSLILSNKDGGNVTTYRNFEKGITSSESDRRIYENGKAYDENPEYRKEVRAEYDKKYKNVRSNDFNNQDVIIDGYTGKELKKDGSTHFEHIRSVHEVESDKKLRFATSQEERINMTVNPDNYTYTDGSLNISKSDQPLDDFMNKSDKNGVNNMEKYGIDEQKARAKDAKARKNYDKLQKDNTLKKYTTELVVTGAKDAAMIGAYTIIVSAVKEFVDVLFREIHLTFKERGNENFKEIFIRFKNGLQESVEQIKSKFKKMCSSAIWTSISAFLSNILVFVINLFATTLRKIVAMIRAGFTSLLEAIRILSRPPEGLSKEEARYAALKVLTAGLIGALSLGLSAAIETLLKSIPGLQPIMMFPISANRTLSDALAVVISSMIGGVVTTVVLYFMDKFRSTDRDLAIKFQLIPRAGMVTQYRLIQTYYVVSQAYQYVDYRMQEHDRHQNNLANEWDDRLVALHENRLTRSSSLREEVENVMQILDNPFGEK